MSKPITSENYHDYVIQDGEFIGEFEQMYQNCENPWPETEKDLEELPTSSRTPYIINKNKFSKVFSLGCGKGMHLNWLSTKCPEASFAGCDIAPSAVSLCQSTYPHLSTSVGTVDDFIANIPDFDLLIVREVVWYFLDRWQDFCDALQKVKGRHIIVELSFYDNQKYGTGVFDGPDDFVKKFPFSCHEIVRYHVTKKQREGMLFLFAKI